MRKLLACVFFGSIDAERFKHDNPNIFSQLNDAPPIISSDAFDATVKDFIAHFQGYLNDSNPKVNGFARCVYALAGDTLHKDLMIYASKAGKDKTTAEKSVDVSSLVRSFVAVGVSFFGILFIDGVMRLQKSIY